MDLVRDGALFQHNNEVYRPLGFSVIISIEMVIILSHISKIQLFYSSTFLLPVQNISSWPFKTTQLQNFEIWENTTILSSVLKLGSKGSYPVFRSFVSLLNFTLEFKLRVKGYKTPISSIRLVGFDTVLLLTNQVSEIIVCTQKRYQ